MIDNIKHYCQKILPLVYDDSLSYYEVLCKIVNAVNQQTEVMNEFTTLNQFKWDGAWSIEKSYSQWTIVDKDGNGYLSIKPVPSGVQIDNEDYWILVANYSALYADFQQRVNALESNVNELIEDVTSLETAHWLYGKRAIVFGDSVVASSRTNNYIYKLANKYNMSITNRAVAGYPLAHSGDTGNCGIDIISRETDLSNYDIAFICYGTNDWNITVSLLDSDDNTTFKSALRSAIKHIQNLNEACKIVCVTPTYCQRDFVVNDIHQGNHNGHGYTCETYANAMIEVCNEFNVLCIDAYHNTNCNEYTVNTMLDSGDIMVHPTETLYKVMADIVANTLTTPVTPKESLNNNYINEREFGTVTTNEEWANIALKGYSGVFFKIGNNSTSVGTITHTFYKNKKYRMRGYSNRYINIKIGDFQISVIYDFDFEFSMLADIITTIEITNPHPSSSVVVGGLYLSDVLNEHIGYDSFNNCNPLQALVNMQTTIVGYTQVSDNMLKLNGGYYKPTVPVNAQTKMWGVRYFNIGTDVIFFSAMDLTTHTPVLMYLSNDGIYNYEAIPANHVIVLNPMTVPLYRFYQNQ